MVRFLTTTVPFLWISLFIRHSAGTYDEETDTGGSNGAGMRYEAEGGDPANAGLQHARVFLEPVGPFPSA